MCHQAIMKCVYDDDIIYCGPPHHTYLKRVEGFASKTSISVCWLLKLETHGFSGDL